MSTLSSSQSCWLFINHFGNMIGHLIVWLAQLNKIVDLSRVKLISLYFIAEGIGHIQTKSDVKICDSKPSTSHQPWWFIQQNFSERDQALHSTSQEVPPNKSCGWCLPQQYCKWMTCKSSGSVTGHCSPSIPVIKLWTTGSFAIYVESCQPNKAFTAETPAGPDAASNAGPTNLPKEGSIKLWISMRILHDFAEWSLRLMMTISPLLITTLAWTQHYKRVRPHNHSLL